MEENEMGSGTAACESSVTRLEAIPHKRPACMLSQVDDGERI